MLVSSQSAAGNSQSVSARQQMHASAGRLGTNLTDTPEKSEAHAFNLLHERVPFDRTCEEAQIPLEFCTLTLSSVAVPEDEAAWFRQRFLDA